jgi:two-component system chemotaxis response regulator CheB
MSKPIRVLIVDDSAVVRQVLQQVLGKAPGIEVMGAVSDPVFAMTRMKADWPDVIVLDVEMPRMDGITFLKLIMEQHPTPVVICSTLTEKGSETTFQALSAGAVSIVTKPKVGLKDFLQDSSNDIVDAVKAAARANIGNLRRSTQATPVAKAQGRPAAPAANPAASAGATALHQTTDHLIAIGTSTGGTQALEAILCALPATAPGIVIVQHMPERFTALFAQRLDSLCAIRVREAVNGDRVLPGLALIAPGGKHMQIRRSGAQYHAEVTDGPLVNRHKPSVDVLFRSVARCAGRNATGFILTGMGDDGARGLKEMRDAGAPTVAQDEASCVVFGMPKEAIALNAAEKVMDLARVPAEIMRYAR